MSTDSSAKKRKQNNKKELTRYLKAAVNTLDTDNKKEDKQLVDNKISQLKAMMGSMESANDKANIKERQEILDFAAYLLKKDIIDDGIHENGVYNMDNPVAFQSFLNAMNKTEDILTRGQMFKTTDKEDFIKTQQSEIQGLEEMKVFAYIEKNILPKDEKLLRAVWSYRQKKQTY